MAPRAPHPFSPFLLEHANFGPARLALDEGHDACIGDEGRAGDDVAAVLFDEQHLLECELAARRARRALQGCISAGRHLDLLATGLDDRVHVCYLCKTTSVASLPRIVNHARVFLLALAGLLATFWLVVTWLSGGGRL